MAIKIRKKNEEESSAQVLEPEVLPPEGQEGAGAEAPVGTLQGFDDKFVMKSRKSMEWLMEHRWMIILGIVVVLCICFGYLGFNYMQESAAISRSDVMNDAFVTYTAMTKDQAAQMEAAREAALKEQGIAADTSEILRATYTVPDDKTRFATIQKYLKGSLPEYNGEAIKTTGDLMLAGTSMRAGLVADAKAAYDEASTSASADVKLFAILGQAELLITDKKYDEAIALYDRVMSTTPGFTSYITYEKARVMEMKGSVDEAIKAYAQICREYSNSAEAKDAKARLISLTADWSTLIQAAPAPAQVAL